MGRVTGGQRLLLVYAACHYDCLVAHDSGTPLPRQTQVWWSSVEYITVVDRGVPLRYLLLGRLAAMIERA